MGWFARVLLTSCISIVIALGLAALYQLEQDGGMKNEEMTVFRVNQIKQLREEDLVDDMIALSLEQRIKKVDWSHSILSIDLAANLSEPVSEIFADLYELIYYSFVRTGNVKQVLVRVMEEELAVPSKDMERKQSKLLLAMDAKRSDALAEEIIEVRRDEAAVEPFLHHHFQFTYAKKWQDVMRMN